MKLRVFGLDLMTATFSETQINIAKNIMYGYKENVFGKFGKLSGKNICSIVC